MKGKDYEEKLKDAGLTTLKARRRRGDAIEVFKTMKGINNVRRDGWFKLVGSEARPTRANAYVREGVEVRREWVIEVERANQEIRRNFFTIRAAKVWNELPENVKKQENVNSFKNAYDTWRRKKPHQQNQQSDRGGARENDGDDGEAAAV